MWSLGITFFEILVGRTPFEYVEGEMLTESNFRPELQQRAVLDAYDALLDAGVIHGDSSGSCTFEM